MTGNLGTLTKLRAEMFGRSFSLEAIRNQVSCSCHLLFGPKDFSFLCIYFITFSRFSCLLPFLSKMKHYKSTYDLGYVTSLTSVSLNSII